MNLMNLLNLLESDPTKREKLMSCKGSQAINRMGALAEMHNILSYNYNDLTNHIKELSYLPPDYQEIILLPLDRLKQYIFNFFMATTALRDNCRRLMGNYKGSHLKKEYDEKIKIFHCDLVRFVEDLRNNHTHAQPARPMIVKDKKHIPLWNIVFLTPDLLKNSMKWSTGAKTYMQTQGNEIRIYDVCLEYYRLVDQFYFWLYKELKKHHQKDLEERNKMMEDFGIKKEMDAFSQALQKYATNPTN